MEPLKPRITKSTAVAAIKARFPKTSDLLRRFELAKAEANKWDGEPVMPRAPCTPRRPISV